MRRRSTNPEIGALLIGAIFLLVGGYYLLTNTFGLDLPELSWDATWPLFVIALGIGIMWRAVDTRSADRP